MEENTITTVELRKLRELIRDITSGCILTHDEYNQICGIIMGAISVAPCWTGRTWRMWTR